MGGNDRSHFLNSVAILSPLQRLPLGVPIKNSSNWKIESAWHNKKRPLRRREVAIQWRIQGRSLPPPLFLDQNEARRAAKSFFVAGPTPPYLRVWMTAPPPPLISGSGSATAIVDVLTPSNNDLKLVQTRPVLFVSLNYCPTVFSSHFERINSTANTSTTISSIRKIYHLFAAWNTMWHCFYPIDFKARAKVTGIVNKSNISLS